SPWNSTRGHGAVPGATADRSLGACGAFMGILQGSWLRDGEVSADVGSAATRRFARGRAWTRPAAGGHRGNGDRGRGHWATPKGGENNPDRGRVNPTTGAGAATSR